MYGLNSNLTPFCSKNTNFARNYVYENLKSNG